MEKLVVLCVVMCLAGLAGAAVTGVTNGSFEAQAPIADPYYDAPVTDWYDYGGSFIIDDIHYADYYAATPYGDVIGGVENGGGMYQQIGTWDAGETVEVGMWLSKRKERNFNSLVVSLWQGGTGAADGTAITTIGATLLDSVTLTPFTTEKTIQITELIVKLNSGTTGTAGEALWLSFEGTGGSGQRMIDNVYAIPEPASMLLLGIGGLLSLKRRRA